MLRSAQGVVVDGAELSDPGRDPEKQLNEDSLALTETAFGVAAVVCDGMGGHASGEVASKSALSRVLEVLRAGGQPVERLLGAAIERAHADVYALGGDAPIDSRPGSTVVVVALAGREALVAHVGDSRAYRVRARAAERLTRDHSVVEALLAAGAISPLQAAAHPDANRITRALGIAPEIEPELAPPVHVAVGDAFVLCSDGLSDLVSDDELAEHVSAAASPEAACQALVALANQRGGHDNVSVVVMRVLSLGAPRAGSTAPHSNDHTVVDHPTFTVVMGTETPPAPPPTVGFDSDPVRRTVPTLVDPLVAAAQQGAAKTVPGAPLPPMAVGPPKTPVAPLPGPGAPETRTRPSFLPFVRPAQGRMLFWSAVAVCALIFAAIALWSLIRD